MEKILLALTGLGAKFEALQTKLTEAQEAAAKNVAAPTDIKALEDLQSQLAARDATIKDLNAKLETAQTEVNAKGTEIKTLAEKAAAAEKKADEALAAMGVPPEKIPAADPAQAAGAKVSEQNKTWTQRCQEAKKNAK